MSQYALPARAAERLFEIVGGMDAPHGFVSIGKLNYALLRESATPDEYRAGIQKLVADGLITVASAERDCSLRRTGTRSSHDAHRTRRPDNRVEKFLIDLFPLPRFVAYGAPIPARP